MHSCTTNTRPTANNRDGPTATTTTRAAPGVLFFSFIHDTHSFFSNDLGTMALLGADLVFWGCAACVQQNDYIFHDDDEKTTCTIFRDDNLYLHDLSLFLLLSMNNLCSLIPSFNPISFSLLRTFCSCADISNARLTRNMVAASQFFWDAMAGAQRKTNLWVKMDRKNGEYRNYG